MIVLLPNSPCIKILREILHRQGEGQRYNSVPGADVNIHAGWVKRGGHEEDSCNATMARCQKKPGTMVSRKWGVGEQHHPSKPRTEEIFSG